MALQRDQRLASLDLLRGLVMVIMALDHVRDMVTQSPPSLDFAQTSAPLFFTRWVTHLCAPTFVFLAGISAFLFGAKGRSTSDVSRFLVTRGAWLVFAELTFVTFAWHFHIGPDAFFILGVIWAIGVSMLALAGLIWLPRVAVAGIGALMVLGHNLVDGIQPAAENASSAWHLLHLQGLVTPGGVPVFVVYPLIPWIGLMALGYALGPLFARIDPGRPRRLVGVGVAMTLAFLGLRLANAYGEPDGWIVQATLSATLVDFFDTTKYPPSLQFLLMTLGPALILLGLFERARGPLASALTTIGRVPFFYYILHLYVIHAVALGLGLIQGFPIHEIAVIFFAYPEDFGVDLGTAYVFWAAIVLALYPACRWFAGVKARHPGSWLSYL